jgi:Heavy metal associated domain 2
MKHKHRAKVAHHVPGRMRLKLDSAKGNDALLEDIRQNLATMPGVHEILINASTGSVTVHYSVEAHPELLASIDKHQDHFSVAPAAAPGHVPPGTKIDDMTRMIEEEADFLADHSDTARVVVNFCKEIDRNIKKATNNSVDLKVIVPLGLAAVTFLEIGATAATPVWVTIGLFSLNHFIELQAHQAAAARRDKAASSPAPAQPCDSR